MRDDEHLSKRRAGPPEPSVADPSADFAYELATQAPTKDVASIKAASDVYEANVQDADGGRALRPDRAGRRPK